MSSPLQLMDESLFEVLLTRAKASHRLRTNHNFHPDAESNPHRFLNVMVRGTYVTPHRHLHPPKSESFVVLRGRVALLLFDDHGSITECTELGGSTLGADLQPGVWHSLVVLSEHAVCFEVKPGPYLVSNDKEFAPWAPHEGQADTAQYLTQLDRHIQQHLLQVNGKNERDQA